MQDQNVLHIFNLIFFSLCMGEQFLCHRSADGFSILHCSNFRNIAHIVVFVLYYKHSFCFSFHYAWMNNSSVIDLLNGFSILC